MIKYNYIDLPKHIRDKIDLLNFQQKAFLEKVVNWYFGDLINLRYKGTGYAGTGKTFVAAIILETIQWLSPTRLKFIGVAPSHKAKRQLHKSINQSVPGLEYFTIASFLGKAPEYSEGKEVFRKQSKQVFDEDTCFDLGIFDEYGMIGKDDAVEILNGFYNGESYAGKILFLGDSAQLPPVKETISYIDAKKSIPESELTEVVRYGGDLLEVANSWNIKKNLVPIPLTGSSLDGTIAKLGSKKKMVEHFVSNLKIALSNQDYDHAKIIGYTNKNCANLNDWVREFLHGNDAEIPYLPGDRLIATKPILRQNAVYGDKSIVCENSMEFTTLNYLGTKTVTCGTKEYECHQVLAQPDIGETIELCILCAEYMGEYTLHLSRLKKQQEWQALKILGKLFDHISFAYAITCHKSQGSTFKFNYLDMSDLLRCQQQKQIIYTAITRTQEVLYVY